MILCIFIAYIKDVRWFNGSVFLVLVSCIVFLQSQTLGVTQLGASQAFMISSTALFISVGTSIRWQAIHTVMASIIGVLLLVYSGLFRYITHAVCIQGYRCDWVTVIEHKIQIVHWALVFLIFLEIMRVIVNTTNRNVKILLGFILMSTVCVFNLPVKLIAIHLIWSAGILLHICLVLVLAIYLQFRDNYQNILQVFGISSLTGAICLTGLIRLPVFPISMQIVAVITMIGLGMIGWYALKRINGLNQIREGFGMSVQKHRFETVFMSMNRIKTVGHLDNCLAQFFDALNVPHFFYSIHMDGYTKSVQRLSRAKTEYNELIVDEIMPVRDFDVQFLTHSVVFGFPTNCEAFGWGMIEIDPSDIVWIKKIQPNIECFSKVFSQHIQIVETNQTIEADIKVIHESNDFIAQLLQFNQPLNQAIFNQLFQRISFDHLVCVMRNNDELTHVYSTTNLKECDKRSIDQMLHNWLADDDYQLIEDNKYPETDPRQQLLNKLGAKKMMIIPMALSKDNVGYYIGFFTEYGIDVNHALLSAKFKQVGVIFNQTFMDVEVSSTKDFYRHVLDSIQQNIVVVKDKLDITYKNKTAFETFGSETKQLKQIIERYDSFKIIDTIMHFTRTEVVVDCNNRHHKININNIGNKEMVLVISDVSDVTEITEIITKSSRFNTLGMFVAGVAHEIKNPLVAIKTFTEMTAQDFSNQSVREKCVSVAYPQIEKIQNLSLSLGKMIEHQWASFEPINLSDVLHEMIPILSINSCSEMVLEHDLQPNIWILGHTQLIEQMMLNLVANAADAMGNSRNPTIIIQLSDYDGKYGMIDLSDNGHGIDPKDLSTIFEPFYTKKTSGTGLGLSIVSQIVMDHHGTIEAFNRLDGGAMFRIKIPCLSIGDGQ